MKHYELVALSRKYVVPTELEKNWMDSMSLQTSPTASARQVWSETKTSIFMIITGFALIAMMTFISYYNDRPVENKQLWVLALGLVLIISALAVLFSYEAFDDNQFGTECEELAGQLGFAWIQLCSLPFEKLVKEAEHQLFAKARAAKNIQAEDPQSSGFAPTRAEYAKLHAFFRKFGLCEEKWDKYWKTEPPAPAKTETVAVARPTNFGEDKVCTLL